MVDDYHLEIMRGSDLMGRWYLADVEVVRDIAERFRLFLGPDEMEFLADDALVFAYDGVTRMQQGWVNAKKKKRRHRRAAADAARRKDAGEPESVEIPGRTAEEVETALPAPRLPTSDLAKKLAAIAAAEAAATEPSRSRRTWAEAEAEEDEALPRRPARSKSMVSPDQEVETSVEPESVPARKLRTRKTAAVPEETPLETVKVEVVLPPVLDSPPPTPPVSARSVSTPPAPDPPPAEAEIWVTPLPEPTVKETEPEWREESEPLPSWLAPPLSAEPVTAPPPPPPEPELPPAPSPDPESADELTPRRQRRRGRKDEVEPEVEAPPREVTSLASAREAIQAKAAKEDKNAGHHPAETNVGLLSKLRRQSKPVEAHEHVYEETRSIGGLTRRVCLECSHVSIVADD